MDVVLSAAAAPTTSINLHRDADLDTGLIEREQALLFPDKGVVPAEVWLIAALAELQREAQASARQAACAGDPHSPWRLLDGWPRAPSDRFAA